MPDSLANRASGAKTRHAGIELLRILMMLEIVYLHLAIHGGFETVAEESTGFLKVSYWTLLLFARCPVYVFVMITGYFLSTAGTKINFKRLLKVYLPMLFYSIVLRIVFAIAERGVDNPIVFVKSCLPVISKQWYFMTLYLLIVIFSPFLNLMIERLDRKQFLILVGLLFFIFSIWQPLSKLDPMRQVVKIENILWTEEGKGLYGFVYMYIVGAFMRRHKFIKKAEDGKSIFDKPWIYIVLFFVFLTLNVLLVLFYPDKRVEKVAYYYDHPLTVLQGICLFRIFEMIKLDKFPKLGKVIAFISAGNLGVYMISEFTKSRTLLWTQWFNVSDPKFYGGRFWLIKLALIVFAVYCGCWLLDLLTRRVITRLVENTKKKR
ncbi:MAG: acyltransferase [Clostridiales bacterium]|nr:acyltransferase [Clostridiales bacterium]